MNEEEISGENLENQENGIPEGPSEEELQQERNQETNKKVAKVAAKYAANAFLGPAGGKVVDIVSKTKVGNEILDKGGEAVSKVTDSMPMGDKLQEGLNQANDAGAIDMAEGAVDAAGGDATSAGAKATGASNALNSSANATGDSPLSSSIGTPSSSSSPSSSLDIIKPPGMGKGLPKIAIGVALGILLLMFLMLPESMLQLTDGYGKASAKGLPTELVLSDEQIEKSLIYVGDSRILGIQTTLNNSSISYIAQGSQGYNWYVEQAQSQLYSYISADTTKYVVLALGLNDLGNVDKYINIYSSLISGYQKVKFYFLSINPVNEELTSQNGINITNIQIEAFNTKLSSVFNDNFIDTYSQIKDSFNTTDGINYSDETNKEIHQTVLDFIKSKNVITFLDSYPTIKESKILQQISIVDALGNEGVTNLESYIKERVDAAGRCTSAAVAGAAVGLIYGLHLQGYHLPYYYGGGHGNNNIIDLRWGSNIGPSILKPSLTRDYYGGLDCSGFTSWAANAAGIPGVSVASSYLGYGPSISFEEASPGDVIANKSHVILIIENKGDYLQTAESTTGGVQFTTCDKAKISRNKYTIVDMDDYYQKNCH